MAQGASSAASGRQKITRTSSKNGDQKMVTDPAPAPYSGARRIKRGSDSKQNIKNRRSESQGNNPGDSDGSNFSVGSRNSRIGGNRHNTNSSRGSMISNTSSVRRKQAFTSVALHKGSSSNRPPGLGNGHGSFPRANTLKKNEQRMRNTDQKFNP